MPSHKTRTKPAAAVAAVSLFALASVARGAVLCQNPTPDILVPATTAGVYVNLVTATATTTPAASPGWDFNPWGSTSLNFWFNNSGDPSSAGAVAASTGGIVSVLASGATIGPAQFYSDETPANPAEMATWQAGSTGQYLGVRFWNSNIGVPAINYGWIQIDTTASTGHPSNIRNWCYDDSGAAITAGTSPVELETFTVD